MRILLLLVSMAFAFHVQAQQSFGMTAEEKQLCKKWIFDRKHAPTDTPNDWSVQHHHCDGIRMYQRALAARAVNDKVNFNYNLQLSLSALESVLNDTSPGYSMRPELFVLRGRTLELWGRGPEAVGSYMSALELNPNFSMAYAALGNYYVRAGNKQEALKVYEEALRRNPKNKYIRARYEKLSGSKGKPEP